MTLFFSSPIGLGHITRDIAIAKEIAKSFNYHDFDFITGSKAFDFMCNDFSSEESKFNVHNLFSPPEFSIKEGELRNSFLWLLKYVYYFEKSKIKVKKFLSTYTRGKNWETPPLIITDEDFACLSVGKEMNIPRILITDILGTHFIRTSSRPASAKCGATSPPSSGTSIRPVRAAIHLHG